MKKTTTHQVLASALFASVLIGSMFLTSRTFVSEYIAPKYYCAVFGCAALALYWEILELRRHERLSLREMVLPICGIVSAVCTAQSIYGLLQAVGFMSHLHTFRLNGSFDNPAGFAACVCAGAPCLLPFISYKQRWVKCTAFVATAIILLAVVLSGSRAGMLSLAIVIMLHISRILRINRYIILIISIVVVVGLYFVKKDSADGRVLIWRVSAEMVKDKPLLGYGAGGFTANYMNYQAKYFEAHPDSKYAMLADNVRRPFNEYVELLTNYGMTGLLALAALGVFLWLSFCRIKDKTIADFAALYTLVGIGVFAFFSYPLTYSFVIITGTMSVLMILSRAEYNIRPTPSVLKILLITIIMAVTAFIFRQMEIEKRWARVARQSLAGHTEEMLPEYDKLYKSLNRNDLFMYNYAAELNAAGYYDESLKKALECEHLLADFDLQMLIAENCTQLKRYQETEQSLILASQMCPAKFTPLYELAKLYEATGELAKAKSMAVKIIQKKAKIPSAYIEQMKEEMKELLNTIFTK